MKRMSYETADELRKAIKAVGAAEVARIARVKPTTLYSFLDGKTQNLRGDNFQRVVEALALKASRPAPVPDETFEPVPIFDIRASAGAGALVEDGEPTGWQPYRSSELARWNLPDLAVIQVGGDSMWDTLHDGDKILINRAERRIVRDGIYVIAFEGELLVKRCQRNFEDGSVLITSDNKAYQSFRITKADKLDVIGRVIWIGRALG